jgi:ribosomal protein S18 acetylase RimI-like enzyme
MMQMLSTIASFSFLKRATSLKTEQKEDAISPHDMQETRAVMIKEITAQDQISESVHILRQAFKTVADEFSLTPLNCPTHPSFITYDALSNLHKKGAKFFGLFIDEQQIGFIAIEKSGDGLYYIEKLAIIPSLRHKGYGELLLRFAFEFIKNSMGNKISIGIISNHTVLKKWYKGFGFKEITTKKFDHLPFTVCFMEKTL